MFRLVGRRFKKRPAGYKFMSSIEKSMYSFDSWQSGRDEESMSTGDVAASDWSPSADLSRLLRLALEDVREDGEERTLGSRRTLIQGGFITNPTTAPTADDQELNENIASSRPLWATQANVIQISKNLICHYNSQTFLYTYSLLDTLRLASLLHESGCLNVSPNKKAILLRLQNHEVTVDDHPSEEESDVEGELTSSFSFSTTAAAGAGAGVNGVRRGCKCEGIQFSTAKRRLLAKWLLHPVKYVSQPNTFYSVLGDERSEEFRLKLLAELERHDEVWSDTDITPGVNDVLCRSATEPYKITPVNYSPTIPIACARLGMNAESSRNWVAFLRSIVAFAPMRLSYQPRWLECVPFIIEDLVRGESDQLARLLPLPSTERDGVSFRPQHCWRSSDECFQCQPLTCISAPGALKELFMSAAIEFGSSYALILALQLQRAQSLQCSAHSTAVDPPTLTYTQFQPHNNSNNNSNRISGGFFDTSLNVWTEKYGDLQTSRDIQRVLQRGSRRQMDWEIRRSGKMKELRWLRFYPE